MEATGRKKQPEAVKAALIDAATELTIKHGWANFSLDAVARSAGVSKGGLIHHFPSKQALLDALSARIVEYIDEKIDETMKQDPNPVGRFVRAYLQLPLADDGSVDRQLMVATTLAAKGDQNLNKQWQSWLDRRMPDSEKTVKNLIVKYAADGIWFSFVFHEEVSEPKINAIMERLVEFSKTED